MFVFLSMSKQLFNHICGGFKQSDHALIFNKNLELLCLASERYYI